MYRAVVPVFLLICAVPAVAEEPTVTITLRDHRFVPSEVPVLAGVKLKLIIRNQQAENAEFESTSLHREKIVNPGGAAEFAAAVEGQRARIASIAQALGIRSKQ